MLNLKFEMVTCVKCHDDFSNRVELTQSEIDCGYELNNDGICPDCKIIELCEDCGYYSHEGVCEYALCDDCGSTELCSC